MTTIQTESEVGSLMAAWCQMFPCDSPDNGQFVIWLSSHEPSIVRKAIGITASKCRKLHGQMTTEHAVRFASSVMNRLDDEKRGIPGAPSGQQHEGKFIGERRIEK